MMILDAKWYSKLSPEYEEWLLDNDHLDSEEAAGLTNGEYQKARNAVTEHRKARAQQGEQQ